ncbi:MAG: hypothetical protein U0165_15695 [Polyangiaceae bacterium]
MSIKSKEMVVDSPARPQRVTEPYPKVGRPSERGRKRRSDCQIEARLRKVIVMTA